MSTSRAAWCCAAADPDGRGFCRTCGAEVGDHPLDICRSCNHRVSFHGSSTDGCSRMVAGLWCVCQRSFGQVQTPLVVD